MTEPEMIDAIAREFSKGIREALTAEQLAEVVRRNRDEYDVGVCATHDFIDANEVMADAFMAALGHSVDADCDGCSRQWSAAWAKAKAAGFAAASEG